jgi:uncharacterized protein YceK
MRLIKPGQFVTDDCGCPAKNPKIANRRSSIFMCCLVVLLLSILLGGCSGVSQRTGTQQQLSHEERLSAPYDQTQLKESLTLDVLPKIQRSQEQLGGSFAETELLSRSESVVASLGTSKDGHKTWFNMVAFHEYRLNVIRKYFFLVDDKASSLTAGSRRGLRFDCQMVLEKQVPDKPEAPENTSQIAILRYVLDNTRKDIDEIGAGTETPGQSNKTLDVCGMLINQTLETILLKLDSSPALAARLSEPGGVEFDHINFGKGKIQMVVEGDTVAVKIRLGAFEQTI